MQQKENPFVATKVNYLNLGKVESELKEKPNDRVMPYKLCPKGHSIAQSLGVLLLDPAAPGSIPEIDLDAA